MLRKFQKKGGFDNEVEYLEYDVSTGVTVGVDKDGKREKRETYPLTVLLEFVDSGEWIELKPESEEPKMCEGGCKKSEIRLTNTVVSGIPRDMMSSHVLELIDAGIILGPKSALPPIDFSTAQVGDTLRCKLNGDVKVSHNHKDRSEYPVCLKKDGDSSSYTTDGKLYTSHENPCLIGFVDSSGKLCRTRPEPEIDWSKVAVDTPVEITKGGETGIEILNYCGNTYEGLPVFFRHGRTSHTLTPAKQTSSFINATYKIIDTKSKGE